EANRARGEQAERVFETAFGSGSEDDEGELAVAGLHRSASDLGSRVARAVSGWQDQLIRLVGTDNSKELEAEPLSLVTFVAMLGDGSDREDRIITEPRQILGSTLNPDAVRELAGRARSDLTERVRLALDEELLRFMAVLDTAGPVDPVAAVRLYQAEYSLEAAR
ncbi:MAG: hypothetical protein ACRDN0_33745, partial [Trebonia sp.]